MKWIYSYNHSLLDFERAISPLSPFFSIATLKLRIHLAATSWSQWNSFCLQVWYLIPIINNIFYPLMHISLITYYSHITYILHPVHIFYLRFLLPMVRHAKCAKQPWQSSKHLVRASSMQYKKSFQLHVQYRTSVFNQGVTPLRDL